MNVTDKVLLSDSRPLSNASSLAFGINDVARPSSLRLIRQILVLRPAHLGPFWWRPFIVAEAFTVNRHTGQPTSLVNNTEPTTTEVPSYTVKTLGYIVFVTMDRPWPFAPIRKVEWNIADVHTVTTYIIKSYQTKTIHSWTSISNIDA